MPPSSIDLHYHKVLGKRGRHMLQKQIHHLGIGRGENERGHFPFRWRYSRIDVGIVAYDLTWRPGLTPGGAQARLGMLTRPKRPSSSAIFNTGRRSRGSRVANAV